MRPPAPGLFSTITGWPMFSDSFCPTSRAKRSLPPPAAKPTIKWIGRLGKFAALSPCAPAAPATIAASAAKPAVSIVRLTSSMGRPPPLLLGTAFFADRGDRQVCTGAAGCFPPLRPAAGVGLRSAGGAFWGRALCRRYRRENQIKYRTANNSPTATHTMVFSTAEQRHRSSQGAGDLFGHPRGLTFLFATEMWERFSYYGMRALLVLYMVKLLLLPGHAENVIGLTTLRSWFESMTGPLGVQPFSSHIYGLYTGLVYLTPVFGGMLADRVLGQHRTIVLGAAMMA